MFCDLIVELELGIASILEALKGIDTVLKYPSVSLYCLIDNNIV